MKQTFIAAHKMTREIAAKYEVDYQVQFGLCLSYLLNKKGEKTMELQGTEKQVKFAEAIKEAFIEKIDTALDAVETADFKREETRDKNRTKMQNAKKEILNIEHAGELIEGYKEFFYENKYTEHAGYVAIVEMNIMSARVLQELDANYLEKVY